MAIQRTPATTPHTLYYNKQTGKQYLMGQVVPGLYKDTFVSTADAQKNGLVAAPPRINRRGPNATPLPVATPPPPGVNLKLWIQKQVADRTEALAKKGLVAARGGYTIKGNTPKSLGLGTGWAPKIGHITTSAATSKRRTTNPLLTATPGVTARRRNPLLVEQTPSADLFGLNIPV